MYTTRVQLKRTTKYDAYKAYKEYAQAEVYV